MCASIVHCARAHACGGATLVVPSICSAYVQSCVQQTSAYVSIRCAYAAYLVSIRQHTSAYVSIRQHTSAYGAQARGVASARRVAPARSWQCALPPATVIAATSEARYASNRRCTDGAAVLMPAPAGPPAGASAADAEEEHVRAVCARGPHAAASLFLLLYQ